MQTNGTSFLCVYYQNHCRVELIQTTNNKLYMNHYLSPGVVEREGGRGLHIPNNKTVYCLMFPPTRSAMGSDCGEVRCWVDAL